MSVTHDNHIVPQWYLERWADRDGLVWCYPLLVSHENVPLWSQHVVKGVAYRRDLYTLTSEGRDTDDHERWLKEKFEDPAAPAVMRAVQGRNLDPDDWRALALFAVCQDYRTPQSFVENMARWRETFPQVIQETLEKAVRELERRAKSPEPLPPVAPDPNTKWLGEAFRFSINRDAYPEQGLGEIGTHLLLGRDFWLRAQRHILEGGVAEQIVGHSWSIATAAKRVEWFTSDHPVVKLVRDNAGNLSPTDGWGIKGEIIFMPLSRRHLLYTEVGAKLPVHINLTKPITMLFRRAIAQRAWRTIFALQEVPDVARLRPRKVDRSLYRSESEQWSAWHANQTAAEREHFEDR